MSEHLEDMLEIIEHAKLIEDEQEREEQMNELYYQGLICVFMKHIDYEKVVEALLVMNGHNTLELIREENALND